MVAAAAIAGHRDAATSVEIWTRDTSTKIWSWLVLVETARVTKAPPAIRKDPVHIGRGMAVSRRK